MESETSLKGKSQYLIYHKIPVNNSIAIHTMLTSTFIHEKHKLSMKVGIQFTNAAIILTELLKWSKNVLDTQSIKILGKN